MLQTLFLTDKQVNINKVNKKNLTYGWIEIA